MRGLIALVALAALLFAGTAGYGKGGKPKAADAGASTIVVNETNVQLGDTVTFTTEIERLTGAEYPMVDLECTQDGVIVFSQLDHPDAGFLLGGGWSEWLQTGGPASCVAYLDAYDGSGNRWTVRVLASTSFEAG